MRFPEPYRTLTSALVLAIIWSSASLAERPSKPARRVVAVYFHRTVRCPTCQKVGTALEQVLRTSFAAELADGRLEWRLVDFQDPRNASFSSAFYITGPSFVIIEVRDDRVVAWEPAPKAWSLLGDESAFSRYVQAEVRSVLGDPSGAAR